jgi:hypothetical protein
MVDKTPHIFESVGDMTIPEIRTEGTITGLGAGG